MIMYDCLYRNNYDYYGGAYNILYSCLDMLEEVEDKVKGEEVLESLYNDLSDITSRMDDNTVDMRNGDMDNEDCYIENRELLKEFESKMDDLRSTMKFRDMIARYHADNEQVW